VSIIRVSGFISLLREGEKIVVFREIFKIFKEKIGGSDFAEKNLP
jgi:hypothetical protein